MKRARPSLLALPAIAMLVAGVAVPRAADVAPAQSAPAAAAGPVALVVPARGPAAGAPREVLSATGAAPPVLLRDDPRRDRRCLSLASAFGHSANVVFAKLADRDLDPATLRATAERFLFNVAIPFARPLEVSSAEVPADPFDAANTAAGFGSVKLTPLHAALLAAIVANGGVFVPPVLVEQVDGAPLPEPDASRRVVDEEVAARLGAMMRETVAAGTARRVFRRVASSLRGVQVAGTTGSGMRAPRPSRRRRSRRTSRRTPSAARAWAAARCAPPRFADRLARGGSRAQLDELRVRESPDRLQHVELAERRELGERLHVTASVAAREQVLLGGAELQRREGRDRTPHARRAGRIEEHRAQVLAEDALRLGEERARGVRAGRELDRLRRDELRVRRAALGEEGAGAIDEVGRRDRLGGGRGVRRRRGADDPLARQGVEPLVQVEVGRAEGEPDLVDGLPVAGEREHAAVDGPGVHAGRDLSLVHLERGRPRREFAPERAPGGCPELRLAGDVAERDLRVVLVDSLRRLVVEREEPRIPQEHVEQRLADLDGEDVADSLARNEPAHRQDLAETDLRLLLRPESLRELLLGDVSEVHEELPEVLARVVRRGAHRGALPEEEGLADGAPLAHERAGHLPA